MYSKAQKGNKRYLLEETRILNLYLKMNIKKKYLKIHVAFPVLIIFQDNQIAQVK